MKQQPSPQEVFNSLATLQVSPDVWNHHMGGDIEQTKKGLPVVKEIAKSNYRRLAKEHHPDQGGDTEMFRKIQAAWECVREFEVIVPQPNPMEQIRFHFDHGIRIYSSQSFTTTTFWS